MPPRRSRRLIIALSNPSSRIRERDTAPCGDYILASGMAREGSMRRFLGVLAVLLLASGAAPAAETVTAIPAPALDETPGAAVRGRGARRRLLLGRAGRVPARQGRDQRGLGLCRRRQGHGRVRDRQHRHDRPCRVGADHLRPAADHLRRASCRSISRSRTTRPSSIARGRTAARNTARRSFRTNAEQATHRQGLHRPARRRQGLRRGRSSPRSSRARSSIRPRTIIRTT